MREENAITESCFATGVLVLEKLTSGNTNEPRGVEEKGQVLTSRDFSSIVIDSLCNQARG